MGFLMVELVILKHCFAFMIKFSLWLVLLQKFEQINIRFSDTMTLIWNLMVTVQITNIIHIVVHIYEKDYPRRDVI